MLDVLTHQHQLIDGPLSDHQPLAVHADKQGQRGRTDAHRKPLRFLARAVTRDSREVVSDPPTAGHRSTQTARRAYAFVSIMATLLVLAGSAAASTRTYTVSSSNMEPTLHCARPAQGCRANYADKIIVQAVKTIRRGDIVLVQAPKLAVSKCGTTGKFIERVVGLPGQRISGIRVPAASYFLMGDNREMSCDSRMWGFVSRLAVIGRVVQINRATGVKIKL